MEQSDAIELAKEFAEFYGPSYFTNKEDFEPHVWVVAAILAAFVKGYDTGYNEGCYEATNSTSGD